MKTQKVKISELRQMIRESLKEEKSKKSLNESKTKKVDSNKLKNIVRTLIKESLLSENDSFDEKIEKIIEDELMHGHDGPVTEFVIISRAVDLALNNSYSYELSELYSNALIEALQKIKKRGGHIPTGERVQ